LLSEAKFVAGKLPDIRSKAKPLDTILKAAKKKGFRKTGILGAGAGGKKDEKGELRGTHSKAQKRIS